MTVLHEIKDATIAGSTDSTVAGIEQALSEGMSPADIIQNGLIEAMGVVGEKFKNDDLPCGKRLRRGEKSTRRHLKAQPSVDEWT